MSTSSGPGNHTHSPVLRGPTSTPRTEKAWNYSWAQSKKKGLGDQSTGGKFHLVRKVSLRKWQLRKDPHMRRNYWGKRGWKGNILSPGKSSCKASATVCRGDQRGQWSQGDTWWAAHEARRRGDGGSDGDSGRSAVTKHTTGSCLNVTMLSTTT